MSENRTVPDMPMGKDSDPVKTTVKKSRKAQYMEAADRCNLSKLSEWVYQAVEEKLQRDCPDLYKNKK